jgi:hypothetical protein
MPPTIAASSWQWRETSEGERIQVRPLPKAKVRGELHREKQGQKWKAGDVIFEDKNGDLWIGHPKSGEITPFP